MSITRWDPFGDMVSLRDAMERLFSESVVRARAGGGSMANSLAVDVHEEGDDFVVSAPTPGISADDVEITVRGDTVRIRGERREQHQEGGEGQRWLIREQRFGSFDRIVQLPSPVKADGAHADFKDGVLTIRLPKSEEAKERRIPVRSGQQNAQGQDVPIESTTTNANTNQSSNDNKNASNTASGAQNGNDTANASKNSDGAKVGAGNAGNSTSKST